jgi:hypothetical protein
MSLLSPCPPVSLSASLPPSLYTHIRAHSVQRAAAQQPQHPARRPMRGPGPLPNEGVPGPLSVHTQHTHRARAAHTHRVLSLSVRTQTVSEQHTLGRLRARFLRVPCGRRLPAAAGDDSESLRAGGGGAGADADRAALLPELHLPRSDSGESAPSSFRQRRVRARGRFMDGGQ